jgi:hypothetical protein
MLPQEQGSRDRAASSANAASQNRRSLPRASHACQWCRQKKAKCDQQRPCSTCIKQNVDCVYGIRRRNGRKRNVQVQSQAREDIAGGQVQSPSQRSALSTQDETTWSETAARAQDSARLGTYNLASINLLVLGTLIFEPSLYTPDIVGPRRRRSRRRQPAHLWHRILRDVI